VELVRAEDPILGVVILPDVLGLRPLFNDIAGRLSTEQRWSVAVVEQYPGREEVPVQQRLAEMADFDAKRQVADCAAAAELLGTPRVSVLGFCLGGAGALRAAANPRYEHVVSCYGMIRLPDEWRAGGATNPIDDLSASPAETSKVLAIAGTLDPYVSEEDLLALEAIGAHTRRFPGASHQFMHDPDAPSYRPDDATAAWANAVEWLTQ
jgi:carboxymethylenebutenolidase